MPTTRRRRRQEARAPLTPLARHVLEHGTAGATAAGHNWIEAQRFALLRAGDMWAEWRDLILADWRDQGRPGLPWAARFDEEEP